MSVAEVPAASLLDLLAVVLALLHTIVDSQLRLDRFTDVNRQLGDRLHPHVKGRFTDLAASPFMESGTSGSWDMTVLARFAVTGTLGILTEL